MEDGVYPNVYNFTKYNIPADLAKMSIFFVMHVKFVKT